MQSLKSLASKAKAVGTSVAEAVGYTASHEDEDLAKYKLDLSRLESDVSSLRAQMTHYATSMQSLSQAACATSSEVERFYAKSAARAPSVKLFTDANFQLDAFTKEIWKSQLDAEIMSKFEAWQGTQQVHQLGEKVDALKAAKEKREQKGVPLNDKEQQILDKHQEKFINFTKVLEKMRKQLDNDMKKVLDGRYTTFDACFVRFMECQVEFFQHAQAEVQNFLPNINNYRKRFPRNGSQDEDVGNADLAALKQEAQARLKGKPVDQATEGFVGEGDVPPTPPTSARGQKTSGRNQETHQNILDLSNSPAGQGELLEKEAVPKAIPSSPMESSDDPFNTMFAPTSPEGQGTDPAPTPPPTQEKGVPVQKLMDLDDMDGEGADVDFNMAALDSDPPPTPPVSARGNKNTNGPVSPPLSGFSSEFGAEERVAPTPPVSARGVPAGNAKPRMDMNALSKKLDSVSKSNGNGGGTQDILGEDFLDFSSPPASNTSAPTQPEMKRAEPSEDDSDPFDIGNFGGSVPSRASQDNKSASKRKDGHFDDFEMDMNPEKPRKQEQKSATSTSSLRTNAPESEWTDANREAATALGSKIRDEQEASLEQARRIAREQEQLHEAKRSIDDSIIQKINAWEFKNGRTRPRKGLRALLNTLDNVLWEGVAWKKPSVSSLMDKNNVKKAYRKAMLVVHPDKISGGSSPEIQVIAERIFNVLNEEWKVFEASE
eukprot:g8196.t1